MIAKIALLFAAIAAAQGNNLLAPGIMAPGLWNAGLLAPGLAVPSAVSTSSIVGIPGAITTDKRIIGTTGLLTGSPLLLNNGIVGSGLIGASPLALSNGIISPIGLRSARILAGPGLVKTILK